jgi:hypothetical protein
MGWFDLLKNIQISSQKGKQKDIILPPEDNDEDCKMWWSLLEANIAAMLEVFSGKSVPFSFRLEEFTNEELCKYKDRFLKANWYTDNPHRAYDINYTPYVGGPDAIDWMFYLDLDGAFRLYYKLKNSNAVSAQFKNVSRKFLKESGWLSYAKRIDDQIGSSLVDMFSNSMWAEEE